MKLLKIYSNILLGKILWNFNYLTEREKSIIGTEENLNKLKDFSEGKINTKELLK